MSSNLLPKGDYLITGGAGYLGTHAVKMLLEANKNNQIIVIDDLSQGHRQALETIDSLKLGPKIEFIQTDIGQPEHYEFIFKKRKILAVFHFAGFIEVAESVKEPEKYFLNNVTKARIFLETMLRHNCQNLIFSSTASVYGLPEYLPIDENHPTKPINPYGETKLAFEKILEEMAQKHGLNYLSLRYFNAAGADASGLIGENHQPETHLIPCLLKALRNNESVKVYGNNYSTPDGTCGRDYLHVTDLIVSHILGLKYLLSGKVTERIFNLGAGRSTSVLEVIKIAESVTKKIAQIEFLPRRPGDVPVLVASLEKAQKKLGWGRNLKTLEDITRSAWQWQIKK